MSLTTPPALPPSKDEEHLRLLATFHYVLAGIGALFACIPLVHVAIGVLMIVNPESMNEGQESPVPPALFGFMFAGMGLLFVLIGWAAAICTFLSGRYLARREKRTFSFVVAAILCMFAPLGTVLGVFTIIILSKASVQRMYEPRKRNEPQMNADGR